MLGGMELVLASPIVSPIVSAIMSLVSTLYRLAGKVSKNEVNDAIVDTECTILSIIDQMNYANVKLTPQEQNDLRTEIVKLCRSFNFSNGQAKLVENILNLVRDELGVRMPVANKIHVHSGGCFQSRARDGYLNR
jgi:hypothetical protein